jgi:hypothetical protein
MWHGTARPERFALIFLSTGHAVSIEHVEAERE